MRHGDDVRGSLFCFLLIVNTLACGELVAIEDGLVCVNIDYVVVDEGSDNRYFDDLASIYRCISLNLLWSKNKNAGLRLDACLTLRSSQQLLALMHMHGSAN